MSVAGVIVLVGTFVAVLAVWAGFAALVGKASDAMRRTSEEQDAD